LIEPWYANAFTSVTSPFATELTVTKLAPPWTPAQVDMIRCTT
jgi:hypothetical protein